MWSLSDTGLNCWDTQTSESPAFWQLLSGKSISRCVPAKGTAGLARRCVSSSRRPPAPPARMTTSVRIRDICRFLPRRAGLLFPAMGMAFVRYGVPAVLILAGFVILIVVDGNMRWEGWAMCVGAGLAVLLLNVLFRMGAEGDRERQAEEAARDYYTQARPLARRSAVSYGVTSMVAPLRRVLVRRPATAGDWAGAAWRTPDPAGLARQHEAFCALLSDLGAEVEVADALDGQVDAVYMHDPLIMTAAGGIALRMAKPARQAEPGHAAAALDARSASPSLGTLEAPAYADGGDRFWLDERTMAIGLGYRTNRAGADALARLVAPVTVEAYDMPHDQGPGSVLHLQSFLSAITESLCVVYEPLAPVRLLQDLRARGLDWIAIDHDDYAGDGLQHPAAAARRRRRWSTACPRCGGRSSGAASRSTCTTARSSRSRATAGRRALRRRCSAVRIGA